MDLFSAILLAHFMGFIMGVGGATASDALFFKTIKNRQISRDEYKLLHEAGKVVMGGLSLAIISGIGLLLYQYSQIGEITYWENAYFQAKLVLVSLVALNGIAFHRKVLPFMENHLGEDMREEEFSSRFWLFSLTGAVSITSWWGVIFLAVLAPTLPLLYILNIYLLVIASGALFGYLMMTHEIFADREIREDFSEIPHRSLGIAGLLFAGLVVLGGAYHVASADEAHHTVCIVEDPPWFDSPVLEIEPGDTVEWVYCDGDHGIHTHPIESISGPEEFSSGFGLVGKGEERDTFQHTFEEEGVYEYICPTHPYMMGVIAVGSDYHDEVGKEDVWPKESMVAEEEILDEPDVPGVGEIWVNTQYEDIDGQENPGSITVIDAETWEITDTITHESFNNPHNLWNEYEEEYVFQTQWHSNVINKIDVANREVIETQEVGNAPAHLFVHPEEDRLYTTLNNENRVVVTDLDLNILGEIDSSFGAHGIWMDPSGEHMSVAATLNEKLDIIDLEEEEVVETFDAPGFPLATQVTHDGQYAMISLLFEGKVRFVDLDTMEIEKDVEVGELPIWAMPGPKGDYVFVPNTGTADISVIDLETLEVVETLDAGAGAHGISFGEKQGGGYYGYTSNKYEHVVTVIDYENMETLGHIDIEEEKIGGNGILTIPNPYTEMVE